MIADTHRSKKEEAVRSLIAKYKNMLVEDDNFIEVRRDSSSDEERVHAEAVPSTRKEKAEGERPLPKTSAKVDLPVTDTDVTILSDEGVAGPSTSHDKVSFKK